MLDIPKKCNFSLATCLKINQFEPNELDYNNRNEKKTLV